MTELYKGRRILLGSASPRRRQLLEMMEIPFETVSIDVEEKVNPALRAEDVPVSLALLKAGAYKKPLAHNEVLITADTVVIHNGEILGKPHYESDAVEMLRNLSGDVHHVVSGVAITCGDGSVTTFSESTDVEFLHLTDSQIRHYVSHHQPMDKAGAYGIQEWIGAVGVKSVNGCFYNVMGLPTSALFIRLNQILDRI